jgi:hypothetical protein
VGIKKQTNEESKLVNTKLGLNKITNRD